MDQSLRDRISSVVTQAASQLTDRILAAEGASYSGIATLNHQNGEVAGFVVVSLLPNHLGTMQTLFGGQDAGTTVIAGEQEPAEAS